VRAVKRKPWKLITLSVILFIVCDSLLLLAFAGLAGVSSSSILEGEVASYVEKIMDQATINLDNQLTDVRARMIRLTSDTAVQRCLNAASPSYSYTLPYERDISAALREITLFKPYIQDLLIIGKNGYVYNLNGRSNLVKGYDFLGKSWCQEAITPKNNVFVRMLGLHAQDYYNPRIDPTAANQKTFSISMTVTNIRRQPTGAVICNFNLSALGDQLIGSNYEDSGRIALIDQDGVIVSQNGNTGVGGTLALSPDAIKALNDKDEGSLTTSIGGREYLISFSTSEISNWKLVSYIPVSEIHEHSRPIYLSMLPFLLGLLVVNALIARLISGSIDRPVKALVEEVSKIDETRMEPIGTGYHYQELIQISERFNGLLTRLQAMIERDYLSQLQLERSRLSALQAQIQPHFLFNTLQLLQTEMLYKNFEAADGIIVSLSRLLRYAMDNDHPSVPLEREMEYLGDYLSLFARKCAGRLDVRLNVDPAAEENEIPRLLLQPVVENCLKHAFQDNPQRSLIDISATSEGGRLVIRIRDNGRGMPKEQLDQVMAGMSGPRPSDAGVGLNNVYTRLMIAAHGEGKMEIRSQMGEGTEVTLELPLTKKEARR
jgi:two-component system sensor histidine kinase YesM